MMTNLFWGEGRIDRKSYFLTTIGCMAAFILATLIYCAGIGINLVDHVNWHALKDKIHIHQTSGSSWTDDGKDHKVDSVIINHDYGKDHKIDSVTINSDKNDKQADITLKSGTDTATFNVDASGLNDEDVKPLHKNLAGLIGWSVIGGIGLGFLWCIGAWIIVVAEIKRLHDMGQTGFLVFINLFPGACFILWLVLVFASGQQGANEFGPEPTHR